MTRFLQAKWEREHQYRLRKELFSFSDDRIAVQFWYEYQLSPSHAAAAGVAPTQWFRCYGLEDWTFAPDGRMRKRMMSGNDVAIAEADRWFRSGVDVNTVPISETHW